MMLQQPTTTSALVDDRRPSRAAAPVSSGPRRATTSTPSRRRPTQSSLCDALRLANPATPPSPAPVDVCTARRACAPSLNYVLAGSGLTSSAVAATLVSVPPCRPQRAEDLASRLAAARPPRRRLRWRRRWRWRRWGGAQGLGCGSRGGRGKELRQRPAVLPCCAPCWGGRSCACSARPSILGFSLG